MEDGEIARTLRARRGEARLLGRIESQGIHEAVAIVVAEVHDFAVSDRAVTVGQLYVSFGVQALGFLIVDHPIGFECGVAKIKLHIANGRDALVGVVVVDLVGANEHLLLRTFGPDRGLRPRGEKHDLRQSRRQPGRARNHRDGERENAYGRPPGAAVRQAPMVSRARHQPSSW